MLNLLVRLERGLIIFFCLALAALMVVQIILRYVFLAPFLGIEEAAVLLGLWIYFLGVIHVTRTRQHLSGGVFRLFIKSPAVVRAMEVFKHALCAVSSGLFLYFSIAYWIATANSGRSSTYLGWPTTIWISAMVVGFLIAFLLFMAHFWLVLTGKEKPPGPVEEIEHMAM